MTQDAVRGDHGEVAGLLIQHGGKVLSKDGELVELADSPLAGNVRIFTDYDPEWEVDPNSLQMLEKIGASLLSKTGCCTAGVLRQDVLLGVGQGVLLGVVLQGVLRALSPAAAPPGIPPQNTAVCFSAALRRRGRVWHRAQGQVERHGGRRQDPQGDGRRGARRL